MSECCKAVVGMLTGFGIIAGGLWMLRGPQRPFECLEAEKKWREEEKEKKV